MNIDSARELKAVALKEAVKPLVASVRGLSSLALAARSVSEVDRNQRTLAVGIAKKGTQNYHLAVRIQSRALENSAQLEAIRKRAKGEVEVRYIGRVVKRAAPWNQSRQRPLLIGTSIGHFRITAGTLGCFVNVSSTGEPRILSNNHVLADENAGKKRDSIIQPGQFDKGKKGKDKVGQLDRFVKLSTVATNFVDCAIAQIRPGIQLNSAKMTGIGSLNGISTSALEPGDSVHKVGRTTDVTNGRVTAIELDNVVVGYDIGNLRFDNQVEIEGADDGPFSQGGDSGSLIVNDQLQAVALLFAGGDQGGTNGQGLTYGNPIQRVFDELGLELLS